MSTDPELAERLLELFRGNESAHGRYLLSDAPPTDGKKWTGRATTEGTGPSVAAWQSHLAGKVGLGVTPVTADGHCRWGAIDVDAYDLDLPGVAAKIGRSHLPLIPVRTKSGGLHLLLFLRDFTPASTVRKVLREWAIVLGWPTAEVFPKQDAAVDTNSCGSWLNMPYAGGEFSMRYGLGPDGAALTVEEFLRLAAQLAVEPQALIGISPDVVAIADLPNASEEQREGDEPEMPGAPPCLVTLLHRGIEETSDGRNEAMFNFAIYFKHATPGRELERCSWVNDRAMKPVLPRKELTSSVRSGTRRPYLYRCRERPMRDVCERNKCVLRRFGITAIAGDSIHGVPCADQLEIGELIKYLTDPPAYYIDVNGSRIQLTLQQLRQQRLFLDEVYGQANIQATPMSGDAWNKLLSQRATDIKVYQVAPDAVREGQMWHHLHMFCTGTVQARSLDELLLGKPWKSEGRHFFVAADFLSYLTQQRVNGITERSLYLWMKERGLESHNDVIKGKTINFWSIPAFEGQTEPFDVPRDEGARNGLEPNGAHDGNAPP